MDTIAERHLELRTDAGAIAVVASLGMPKNVGIEEWTCACTTRFADEVRSADIHGGDSMQALQLAMATLDVELMHGADRRGGVLFYFDEPFKSILEDSGMQPRTPTARVKPDAV